MWPERFWWLSTRPTARVIGRSPSFPIHTPRHGAYDVPSCQCSMGSCAVFSATHGRAARRLGFVRLVPAEATFAIANAGMAATNKAFLAGFGVDFSRFFHETPAGAEGGRHSCICLHGLDVAADHRLLLVAGDRVAWRRKLGWLTAA